MTQILPRRFPRDGSSHFCSRDMAGVFCSPTNVYSEVQHRLPTILDLNVSMTTAASGGVISGSVSSLVLVAIIVIVLLHWPIYLAVHQTQHFLWRLRLQLTS